MYFNLEFLLLLAYVVFQIFWLLLKKTHQNERGGKKSHGVYFPDILSLWEFSQK